jgi:hypothetical protein
MWSKRVKREELRFVVAEGVSRGSVTALITAVITDTIAAFTNGQLEWAVGT